ncbi:MYND-type domain-containing protein [Chloropicon primus]|uniref:MYND-type domain-containing protein n=1 Tax=Chloropicon primus TaxID=1764295 RepID=A0A5B8MWK1_9CHLO|nr:hypothetical protein A3770_11p64500 [Chloropicon primus]UPR03143.1 MYND-type domain-containing protein [Chloropicon primus]|mmetsp:Transcript_2985/g.8084  ORF Transcript_2985/g.8084 Transcript_2985/m.8084 type:complete len:262 (+) Transcript_2985:213-998(+)|eukprot:QDZ23932.1 hypothetical protein A3770_11p64500 [Chloropicon primus]
MKCGNPSCGTEVLPARMKRCGRCKKEKYCGRECQVMHWRSGHREECKPCKAKAEPVGEKEYVYESSFTLIDDMTLDIMLEKQWGSFAVTHAGHKLTEGEGLEEAVKACIADLYNTHSTPERAPLGTPCASCKYFDFDVDFNIGEDMMAITGKEHESRTINVCRYCMALHMGVLNCALNFKNGEPKLLYQVMAEAQRMGEQIVTKQFGDPAAGAALHKVINLRNDFGKTLPEEKKAPIREAIRRVQRRATQARPAAENSPAS